MKYYILTISSAFLLNPFHSLLTFCVCFLFRLFYVFIYSIILSRIFLPFDVEINNYSVIAVHNQYVSLGLHVFWSISGLQTPEKWRRSSQPPRRTLWCSSLRKRPPSLARYSVRGLLPLCFCLNFRQCCGSGSASTKNRNPHPDQADADPQHWFS